MVGSQVDRASAHRERDRKLGGHDQRPTKSSVRTEKLAFAAIEEARVVLPGIQALFGFQLICGIQRPLP